MLLRILIQQALSNYQYVPEMELGAINIVGLPALRLATLILLFSFSHFPGI